MKNQECINLKGVVFSEGIAKGKAFIYKDNMFSYVVEYDISETDIEKEIQRMDTAKRDVCRELKKTAKNTKKRLDENLAAIFTVQQQILEDPAITNEIHSLIHEHLINAEQALKIVFKKWIKRFNKLPDPQFQQKAEDLEDLAKKMLKSLRGIKLHYLESLPPGSILVARTLMPSDTVFMSRKSVAGVVLEKGGAGSHAALLTRELGVPSIGQIDNVMNHIENGDVLLLDGENGVVINHPDEEMENIFSQRLKDRDKWLINTLRNANSPALTKSGTQITVNCNVSCKEDVKRGLNYGAEGIGLFRTEAFFLAKKYLPLEGDLYKHLKNILAQSPELPATIRLADIGSDKQLPYLDVESEENPCLGCRGIRFLLRYENILKSQLCDIMALATEFDIKILVPMVTTEADMFKVREIAESLRPRIGGDLPPIGAMIETPAAALTVGDLVKYCDFFSVGTNDLTQYTMAAGRENYHVNDYYQDTHVSLIRLLRIIIDECGDKPVSICGELASNPDIIPTLIKMGYKELSVPPPSVPEVKNIIRTVD